MKKMLLAKIIIHPSNIRTGKCLFTKWRSLFFIYLFVICTLNLLSENDVTSCFELSCYLFAGYCMDITGRSFMLITLVS